MNERMREKHSRGEKRERNKGEEKAKEEEGEERKARGFGLSNIAGLKRERPTSSRGSSFTSDASGTRSSFADIPQTRSSFTDMPPPSSKTHSRTHSRLLSSQENLPTPATRRGSVPDARPPSSASRPSSRGFQATSSSFSKYEEIAQRNESFDAPSFESLSGLHLKSREMQHSAVTRTLEGKTVFTIPQLLKTVKAPAYEPPD